MPSDLIVYDLETKESFQEVGTRDPKKLHISVLGAYSYLDDRYFTYAEDELPLFWRRLEQCSLLIGFNNKGFDDQVVSSYFPEIFKVPRFDILEQIYQSIGFRIKLDNIAQATLKAGKSGHGLLAIQLFKEGKLEELRQYCLDDVRLTKEIYDYGKLYGELNYTDFQGKKNIVVNFQQEVIAEAAEPMNLSLF